MMESRLFFFRNLWMASFLLLDIELPKKVRASSHIVLKEFLITIPIVIFNWIRPKNITEKLENNLTRRALFLEVRKTL
jgi:hypothetical protein